MITIITDLYFIYDFDEYIILTFLDYKQKTASFGLSLMYLISSGWFNGCNPAEILEINKVK